MWNKFKLQNLPEVPACAHHHLCLVKVQMKFFDTLHYDPTSTFSYIDLFGYWVLIQSPILWPYPQVKNQKNII